VHRHVASFVKEVGVITCVGEDDFYEDVIRESVRDNVKVHFVNRADVPTIRKVRFVEPGHMRKLFEVYHFDDTPMHGVGGEYALDVFVRAGFSDVQVVESQFAPDPDFPTVPFPNPEEPGATFELLKLAADNEAEVAVALDTPRPNPALQAALKAELESTMPRCARGPADHRLEVTVTVFEDQNVAQAVLIGDEIELAGKVRLVDSATGLVTPQQLWRTWRYGILIIFVVAAWLTPPDAVSQVMLAAPVVVLYMLSMLIAW